MNWQLARFYVVNLVATAWSLVIAGLVGWRMFPVINDLREAGRVHITSELWFWSTASLGALWMLFTCMTMIVAGRGSKLVLVQMWDMTHPEDAASPVNVGPSQ